MDTNNGKKIDGYDWSAFDNKLLIERRGLERDVKFQMQHDHWKGVSVTVAGYAGEFKTSCNVIRRIMRDFRAEIKYPPGTERMKKKRGLISPIDGDWSKHLVSRMIRFKDIEDISVPPKPDATYRVDIEDETIPF